MSKMSFCYYLPFLLQYTHFFIYKRSGLLWCVCVCYSFSNIVLPKRSLSPNTHHFPHIPAALASLSLRYPLRDRKSFRKTAVLISALAHWSPILAEVEFAPSWCYPFVVVFSQVCRYARGLRSRDKGSRLHISASALHVARFRRREGEFEYIVYSRNITTADVKARSMFQRRPPLEGRATNTYWNKIG